MSQGKLKQSTLSFGGGVPPAAAATVTVTAATSVTVTDIVQTDGEEDVPKMTEQDGGGVGSSEKGGGSAGKKRKRGAATPIPKMAADEVKPGLVIWAKFKGCAYWPAKVLDMESDLATNFVTDMKPEDYKADQYLCHFYGTYDVAWIQLDRMAHFADGLEAYRKKNRSKVFSKSIQ